MSFSVPRSRNLVTELPGPRSRELLERRRRAVSRGAGTLVDDAASVIEEELARQSG